MAEWRAPVIYCIYLLLQCGELDITEESCGLCSGTDAAQLKRDTDGAITELRKPQLLVWK